MDVPVGVKNVRGRDDTNRSANVRALIDYSGMLDRSGDASRNDKYAGGTNISDHSIQMDMLCFEKVPGHVPVGGTQPKVFANFGGHLLPTDGKHACYTYRFAGTANHDKMLKQDDPVDTSLGLIIDREVAIHGIHVRERVSVGDLVEWYVPTESAGNVNAYNHSHSKYNAGGTFALIRKYNPALYVREYANHMRANPDLHLDMQALYDAISTGPGLANAMSEDVVKYMVNEVKDLVMMHSKAVLGRVTEEDGINRTIKVLLKNW